MPALRPRLLDIALALALSLPLAAPAMADSPAPAAAVQQAQVVSFTNEADLNQLAAKGQTVVFFYAAWCPDCRATVTDLKQRWSEVHPGLTLVIADYDKEQALKARYGVTYQDTFVLLDAKGNGTAVWNGGGVDGLNQHTRS